MNQAISYPKNELKLLFIKAFIVSLVLSSITGIITLLIGKMGEIEEKILLSICCIGITSLLGLCCSLVLHHQGLSILCKAGVGSAFLALILSLIAIWASGKSETFEKSLSSVLVISLSLAHTSLLMLSDTSKLAIKRMLYVTTLCIALLAFQSLILIWFHKQITSDLYIRLMGVVAILDALGTVVIPIWSKMQKMETTL